MKNIVRNLKLILIRKFEYFDAFEVCVGMFIVCSIIYCKYGFDLVILGVTFDAKMTSEKHLRSVSRAAAQKLNWHHEKVLASIS